MPRKSATVQHTELMQIKSTSDFYVLKRVSFKKGL